MKREKDEGRKNVYAVYTVRRIERRWRVTDKLTNYCVQLALVVWHDEMFKYIQQKNNKLANAILRLIESQRNGEQIDTGLVKKVIDSFGASRCHFHL